MGTLRTLARPRLPVRVAFHDMTVKLVVLYTRPDDPHAFDRHYLSVHLPLTAKMPGRQRVETGRFVAAPAAGEQTYHRVAELYFTDQETLDAAVRSDEGRAAEADYRQIAPPGSRTFVEIVDD